MSTILNSIPAEAQITRIEYEGPRIALYTKNPRYLHQNNYIISEIVNSVKKRVVTRTEKSIRKPEQDVRSILDKALPVEAGATNYFFDDATGEITVEANDSEAAGLRERLRRRRADGADRMEGQGPEVSPRRIERHPDDLLRPEDGR